jgi:hypothetical protein
MGNGKESNRKETRPASRRSKEARVKVQVLPEDKESGSGSETWDGRRHCPGSGSGSSRCCTTKATGIKLLPLVQQSTLLHRTRGSQNGKKATSYQWRTVKGNGK